MHEEKFRFNHTGCSGKIVFFHNSLQPLLHLHRCKRPSKLSTQCECTVTPIGWEFFVQPIEAECWWGRGGKLLRIPGKKHNIKWTPCRFSITISFIFRWGTGELLMWEARATQISSHSIKVYILSFPCSLPFHIRLYQNTKSVLLSTNGYISSRQGLWDTKFIWHGWKNQAYT